MIGLKGILFLDKAIYVLFRLLFIKGNGLILRGAKDSSRNSAGARRFIENCQSVWEVPEMAQTSPGNAHKPESEKSPAWWPGTIKSHYRDANQQFRSCPKIWYLMSIMIHVPPVDHSDSWCLQKLRSFGYEFNQPLDLSHFRSLEDLLLGERFNQPLELLHLPGILDWWMVGGWISDDLCLSHGWPCLDS